MGWETGADSNLVEMADIQPHVEERNETMGSPNNMDTENLSLN